MPRTKLQISHDTNELILSTLQQLSEEGEKRNEQAHIRDLEAKQLIQALSQQLLEMEASAKLSFQKLQRELEIIKSGIVFLANGVKFRLSPEGSFTEIPRNEMQALEELGKRIQSETTLDEVEAMWERKCKKIEKSKIWAEDQVYAQIRAHNQTANYGRVERQVFTEIFGFHPDRYYATPLIVEFNTKLMHIWGTYVMPSMLTYDRPGEPTKSKRYRHTADEAA